MKKVMCFGTFDGVHKGHEFYLNEAKRHGNYLTVVVALDSTVAEVKGRSPRHSAGQRAEQVRKAGIADKVVVGNKGDKLKVVVDEKPDIICLGYDQTFFTGHIKEKLLEKGLKVEVKRIGAFKPEVYKSSKLKEKIQY
ncbi:adenylyltransferase/cytidyltransferase family protein [Candidatus Woesearchaeota archaeon]|nr:adenylyltransferase/cytidyltransferase family protein [Candidatus Woesearchaeota archaeon]